MLTFDALFLVISLQSCIIETQTGFSFLVVFDFCLQLGDFVLEHFLLGLWELRLFFFFLYEHGNLTAEPFLDFKQPKFIFAIALVEHLFVHCDLLSERFFNPVSFQLKLTHPLFYEAVHGLQLSQFAGALFCFLEGGSLAEKDVIC